MTQRKPTNARAPRRSGTVEYHGGAWTIRFSEGPRGERKRWREGRFATREEAEAAAAVGPLLNADSSTMLLDWLDDWHRRRVASLRAAGRDGYASWHDNQVAVLRRNLPDDLRIGELKKRHADDLWTRLLTKGRGPGKGYARGSVGNARTVLLMCIDDAVENDIILVNPITKSYIPAVATQFDEDGDEINADEVKVFTIAERAILVDWLIAHLDDPRAVGALIGAFLGLRRGEIVGLQWRDIDLSERVLHVRRQVVLVDGESKINGGKTTCAKRDIEIPARLATLLTQVKRDRVAPLKTPDWVCPWITDQRSPHRPRPGGHMELHQLYDWLSRKVYKPLGLPQIGVHGLRHTVASILLASGADLLDVSRLLGHADPQTTLKHYAHFIKDKPQKLVDHMDRVLGAVDGGAAATGARGRSQAI